MESGRGQPSAPSDGAGGTWEISGEVNRRSMRRGPRRRSAGDDRLGSQTEGVPPMNLTLSLRRFAVVITVLSGFAVAATAGQSRPFKGWAYESLSAPPVVMEDGIHLIADGVGEATHLGYFT